MILRGWEIQGPLGDTLRLALPGFFGDTLGVGTFRMS